MRRHRSTEPKRQGSPPAGGGWQRVSQIDFKDDRFLEDVEVMLTEGWVHVAVPLPQRGRHRYGSVPRERLVGIIWGEA